MTPQDPRNDDLQDDDLEITHADDDPFAMDDDEAEDDDLIDGDEDVLEASDAGSEDFDPFDDADEGDGDGADAPGDQDMQLDDDTGFDDDAPAMVEAADEDGFFDEQAEGSAKRGRFAKGSRSDGEAGPEVIQRQNFMSSPLFVPAVGGIGIVFAGAMAFMQWQGQQSESVQQRPVVPVNTGVAQEFAARQQGPGEGSQFDPQASAGNPLPTPAGAPQPSRPEPTRQDTPEMQARMDQAPAAPDFAQAGMDDPFSDADPFAEPDPFEGNDPFSAGNLPAPAMDESPWGEPVPQAACAPAFETTPERREPGTDYGPDLEAAWGMTDTSSAGTMAGGAVNDLAARVESFDNRFTALEEAIVEIAEAARDAVDLHGDIAALRSDLEGLQLRMAELDSAMAETRKLAERGPAAAAPTARATPARQAPAERQAAREEPAERAPASEPTRAATPSVRMASVTPMPKPNPPGEVRIAPDRSDERAADARSLRTAAVTSPAATPVVSAGSADWVLRAAQPGRAWIARRGSREVTEIRVGERVAGLGQIEAVQVENGLWVVEGSAGRLRQPN